MFSEQKKYESNNVNTPAFIVGKCCVTESFVVIFSQDLAVFMNIQQWKHQQYVFHTRIFYFFFFSAFLKSAGYFSLLVKSLVRVLNRTWSGASAEHTVCGVELRLHTLKPCAVGRPETDVRGGKRAQQLDEPTVSGGNASQQFWRQLSASPARQNMATIV